jgi:hypothetical protein
VLGGTSLLRTQSTPRYASLPSLENISIAYVCTSCTTYTLPSLPDAWSLTGTMYGASIGMTDPASPKNFLQNPSNYFLYSAVYAVDTFFMISGQLTACVDLTAIWLQIAS